MRRPVGPALTQWLRAEQSKLRKMAMHCTTPAWIMTRLISGGLGRRAGARRPGLSQRQRPALVPASRRQRHRLEYARHGRSLGGESPLEEEVVLTPGRRQLRRREAGWEGSPRRIPAPRNTNRV